MRRPLFLAGFGALTGTFAALYTGQNGFFLLLGGFALLLVLAFLFRPAQRRPTTVFFVSAMLSVCFLFLFLQGGISTLQSVPAETEQQISGTVIGRAETNGGSNGYRVRVKTLNRKKLSGYSDIALYTNGAIPLFTDIQATVTFFPSSSLWAQAIQSDGACASAWLSLYEDGNLDAVPAAQPLFLERLTDRAQTATKDALTAAVGTPYDGILFGTATGDTALLSSTDRTTFRKAGISHLFAVSGLHLSILAGSLLLLLRKLHTPAWLCLILGLPVIWGIVLLAGCSSSILRAAGMLSISLLALLCKKHYDPKNALGGVILILLLFRPLLAADAGFVLSVCASVGILSFAPLLDRRFNRFFRPKRKTAKQLLSGLSVSLAAFLSVLPASVFFFDSFTLIAPLTNLLAVPFAPFVVLFGNLTALFTLLGAPAFVVSCFAAPAKFFAWILLQIGRLFASLPLALPTESTPALRILLLFLTAGILLFCLLRPGWKKNTAVLLSAAVVFCSATLICQGRMRRADSLLIQTGSAGVTFTVRSAEHSFLLASAMTASDSYEISHFLTRSGTNQLDACALLKSDGKSVAAFSVLQNNLSVDYLLANGDLALSDTTCAPLRDTDITLSARCRLHLFDYGGQNAMVCTTDGLKVLLLTGDYPCARLAKRLAPDTVFDYCFCLGSLPKELSVLRCKAIYLCADTLSESADLPKNVILFGAGTLTIEQTGAHRRILPAYVSPELKKST